MTKNQLFRILPEIEIVNSLLEIFGLSSLHDNKFFTKESLKENNTVNKLNDMKDELDKYYLPCKSKVYEGITEKIYYNIKTIYKSPWIYFNFEGEIYRWSKNEYLSYN